MEWFAPRTLFDEGRVSSQAFWHDIEIARLSNQELIAEYSIPQGVTYHGVRKFYEAALEQLNSMFTPPEVHVITTDIKDFHIAGEPLWSFEEVTEEDSSSDTPPLTGAAPTPSPHVVDEAEPLMSSPEPDITSNISNLVDEEDLFCTPPTSPVPPHPELLHDTDVVAEDCIPALSIASTGFFDAIIRIPLDDAFSGSLVSFAALPRDDLDRLLAMAQS
jgi:hypothetical protein